MLRKLTALLIFTANLAAAQSSAPSQTHGTVNVLLANRNGLVLVTDSYLSDKNYRHVDDGPKLFVLDDHTVCAIADFYSDSGPLVNGFRPAYTTAPGILRVFLDRYGESQNRNANSSVSFRLDDLTNLYLFTLSALANLDPNSDPTKPPSGAELTIAGYEGRELHISQVDLKPKWSSNMWSFEPSNRQDRTVSTEVAWRFAGVTDVADKVLRDPGNSQVRSDPILSYFTGGMLRNKGTDLSLNDLRQAAVQLKMSTSVAHSNVVGGKTQWVTMSDGHIVSQELFQPDPNLEKNGAMGVSIISGLTFMVPPGQERTQMLFPRQDRPLSAIYIDVGFKRTIEQLDSRAYIRSVFDDCILEYDGTFPVFFDKNNQITNSVLRVDKSVRDDDELLIEMRANFPSLKIVRTSSTAAH